MLENTKYYYGMQSYAMFTWLLNDLLSSQLKITEAFKSKGWFKNHMDKQGGKGVGHAHIT